MFIERLDPRRLMAAAAANSFPLPGLDTTFADGGRFTFRDDFSERGPLLATGGAIFVPGMVGGNITTGTASVCKIRPDGTPKDPADAVVREAQEETGLRDLKLVSFLARDERDMSDCGVNELQHRWFFHLRYDGVAEETWRHPETSGGKHEPIWFEFFWASLPAGVRKLVADYDQYVTRLPAV